MLVASVPLHHILSKFLLLLFFFSFFLFSNFLFSFFFISFFLFSNFHSSFFSSQVTKIERLSLFFFSVISFFWSFFSSLRRLLLRLRLCLRRLRPCHFHGGIIVFPFIFSLSVLHSASRFYFPLLSQPEFAHCILQCLLFLTFTTRFMAHELPSI